MLDQDFTTWFNEFVDFLAKTARSYRGMTNFYVLTDQREGSVSERFTRDAAFFRWFENTKKGL